MKLQKFLLTWLLLFSVGLFSLRAQTVKSVSVYQKKPNDPEAFFFTPEKYNIRADGKMDVSEALQACLS